MLTDIIEQAADHAVPLTTILRKCLILASRLKQADLQTWVLRELEGYPNWSKDQIPPHRVFRITAKGFFIGPLGSQLNNQPLPSGVLDERSRWWATTAYLMQGVAAYEALVAEDPTGVATVYWPADLVVKYQSKFFHDYVLNRAWQELPIPGIAEMLDTVRTRVLQFALELESDNVDVDAAISKGNVEQISPTVSHIFNTVIYGGSPVVGSQAGQSINIAENQVVIEGDFNSLVYRLQAEGVHPQQIEQLRQLMLSEEVVAKADQSMTERLKGWISAAANTVVKEGAKATLEVATNALKTAISSYLGLPG